MRFSTLAQGTIWTLVDQGVVSVGAFLVNIVLARLLAPAEYGIFVILFSVMLMLQICNAALLFHPLSVRGAVVGGRILAALLGRSMVLVAGLSLVLAIAIGAVVLVLGRADLLVSCLACFLLWQAQEGLRRCLFAELRHREALAGDMIASIGQIVVVAILAWMGDLTLAGAFYAMAVAKGAAALVQARQATLAAPSMRELRRTVVDFWGIGRWLLLNNLVAMLRIQMFPWGLALAFGAASAAGFQAALNILNLANPVVIGLCNIIPQTAARGRARHGNAHAWRATRGMLVLGAVPLAACFGGALAFPHFILWVVYGTGSPYLDLDVALRILAVASLWNYPADIICAHLHGIEEGRDALLVNVGGWVAALALGLPLTIAYGLTGSCVALAVASALRSAAAGYALFRTTAEGGLLRA